MSYTSFVRVGGVGAVVAGAMYLVLAPHALLTSGSLLLSSTLATVVLLVALLGQVVGAAGLHILQRERYGRLGLAGSSVSVLGFVFQFVALSLPTSGVFTVFLLLVGVLAPFVGLVLLGVASLQARALPRWVSVLLIGGLPVVVVLGALLGVGVGAATLGIFWGLVGYTLLSVSRAQIERPARVR